MNKILLIIISFLNINFSLAQIKGFQNKTDDSTTYFTISDTNLTQYRLPLTFEKPQNWKKKIIQGEWYPGEFPDTLGLTEVLNIIDSSDQFWDVCKAKSWCVKNYQLAFPHLVSRLSEKRKVGLENTADLIIWCRLHTGDLTFYGHGGSISEDLFTVSGRASWILNEITGEEFVSVQCDMNKEESEEYKKQWIEYISKLN